MAASSLLLLPLNVYAIGVSNMPYVFSISSLLPSSQPLVPGDFSPGTWYYTTIDIDSISKGANVSYSFTSDYGLPALNRPYNVGFSFVQLTTEIKRVDESITSSYEKIPYYGVDSSHVSSSSLGNLVDTFSLSVYSDGSDLTTFQESIDMSLYSLSAGSSLRGKSVNFYQSALSDAIGTTYDYTQLNFLILWIYVPHSSSDDIDSIPPSDWHSELISPTDFIPSAQPFDFRTVKRDQWYYYLVDFDPSQTRNVPFTLTFNSSALPCIVGRTICYYKSESLAVDGGSRSYFRYHFSGAYLVNGIPNNGHTYLSLGVYNTTGFSGSSFVSVPAIFSNISGSVSRDCAFNVVSPPSFQADGAMFIMYFYFPSSDSSSDLSGAVNPGQDDANEQLGGMTGQLEDFDDQTFGDLNDGLGSLDFGMSGFTEVASGIAYITGIFMIIWNGIPNQIIVVALMLGLVTLVLGRGARLASAVDRANRRRSKKG